MANNLYHNRTFLGNQFSERWSKFRIASHNEHNMSEIYHSWVFFNLHW